MEIKEIKNEKGVRTVEATVKKEDIAKKKEVSYQKNKSKYKVAGFREGKAPLNIIEKNYGQVFLEDAIDKAINEAYTNALIDLNIDAYKNPDVDLKEFSPEKDSKVVFKIYGLPEIEVKDYQGVKVKETKYEVKDSDVEGELNMLKERRSVLEDYDGAIENKMVAEINFKGSVDGEYFKGGSADKYSLEVGSNTFIPGFEEQLLGKKKGDKLDVNVSFPESYQAKELAGKPAKFEVEIVSVKKKSYPEINDEFAKEVSEFNTLEEYKKDIRKKIEERNNNRAKQEKQEKILESVYAKNTVEVPDELVEKVKSEMIDEFSNMLRQQGIDLNNYLNSIGKTLENYKEELTKDAKKRANMKVIINSIALSEKMSVSEDEVNKDLKDMAELYKTDVEKIRESLQGINMMLVKNDILSRKVVDFLYESAIVE